MATKNKKFKKTSICHPAKLCLHTCFPETEKNVFVEVGVGWGDWSDSYISRLQGHPQHLSISWTWVPPLVNPSQGSIMIQGISQGQKQASLTHRGEREHSWAAEVPLVASTHSILGLVFYFLTPPALNPLDTPPSFFYVKLFPLCRGRYCSLCLQCLFLHVSPS